jgi:hypothetical protein
MTLTGKTEELEEKRVPVPLCPQIPHRLNLARTQTSTVRDRRITGWDMARPIMWSLWAV